MTSLERIIVTLATLALAVIVCLIMQAWRDRRRAREQAFLDSLVDEVEAAELAGLTTDFDPDTDVDLQPSFTYGLYGNGNKKRGLLHSFLLAIGLRKR